MFATSCLFLSKDAVVYSRTEKCVKFASVSSSYLEIEERFSCYWCRWEILAKSFYYESLLFCKKTVIFLILDYWLGFSHTINLATLKIAKYASWIPIETFHFSKYKENQQNSWNALYIFKWYLSSIYCSWLNVGV